MSDAVTVQRNAARTAGIAILLVLATGGFAQFFVFLRVPIGNAASTAGYIDAHQLLFRFGLAGALASSVFGIVGMWAFYVLLRPFREHLTLLALLFQLIGSVLFIGTMHDQYLVLHLLSARSFLAPIPTPQLQSAAQLLLGWDDGLRTSLIFSGLGAMIFSWLLFRSRYIPRAISGYAVFADIFSVVSCLVICVAPGMGTVLFPWFPLANFLAMLFLGLWLTIRGAAIAP